MRPRLNERFSVTIDVKSRTSHCLSNCLSPQKNQNSFLLPTYCRLSPMPVFHFLPSVLRFSRAFASVMRTTFYTPLTLHSVSLGSLFHSFNQSSSETPPFLLCAFRMILLRVLKVPKLPSRSRSILPDKNGKCE
jgi:hypothetical protein